MEPPVHGGQLGVVADSEVMPSALVELILEHNRYQSNLSIWDKYLIWTYTLDSGPINRYLLGNKLLSEEDLRWLTGFLNRWPYGNVVDWNFRKWQNYLRNAQDFLDYSERETLGRKMIGTIALTLIRIIQEAPRPLGDFRLYKGSARYPGLENVVEGEYLVQKLINSTSYNPHVNLTQFTSRNCCAYELQVGPSIPLLIIDRSLHAFPNEMEVLIAPDVRFLLQKIGIRKIGYTVVNKSAYTLVQQEPYLIGEMYRQNPHIYCATDEADFTYYTVQVFAED